MNSIEEWSELGAENETAKLRIGIRIEMTATASAASAAAATAADWINNNSTGNGSGNSNGVVSNVSISAAVVHTWSEYAYTSIGATGMVTNLFVLAVFGSNRRLVRQSSLIVGVVVSHFLCAMAIGGIGAWRLFNWMDKSAKIEGYQCLLVVAPMLYPLAFECMGFLLCVIGVERLLALAYPNWFRRNWTYRSTRLLTAGCYLVALLSFSFGIYTAWHRTGLSWSCNHQSLFGAGYILYSCFVSVVGGTVAVSLTLIALCIGTRRIKTLPLLSGETGRYRKQIRLTKTMLSVAFCDFSMVVMPNLCLVIGLINPAVMSPGLVALYANCAYCANAIISLGPYLAFNGQFRADALRLICCCVRRPSIVQKILKSTPEEIANTNDVQPSTTVGIRTGRRLTPEPHMDS